MSPENKIQDMYDASDEIPDYICRGCGVCLIDERIRTCGWTRHECKPENRINLKNTINLRNKIHDLENTCCKFASRVEELTEALSPYIK